MKYNRSDAKLNNFNLENFEKIFLFLRNNWRYQGYNYM